MATEIMSFPMNNMVVSTVMLNYRKVNDRDSPICLFYRLPPHQLIGLWKILSDSGRDHCPVAAAKPEEEHHIM